MITDAVPPAKFDAYSDSYQQAVANSARFFGESAEFFATAKAEYLLRSLGTTFRGKILDYGCGVGLLSHAISTMCNAVIHGFDLSAGSLEKVPPEVRKGGIFTSDLRGLDADYDVIVLANVLHHVPVSNRQALINSLAKRLAARGRVVVFEHNPANPFTRWAVTHCEFDDDAILLWPHEVKRYFENAMLAGTERHYITFFPRFVAPLRRLEKSLGWCPLGGQYVVTGFQHQSNGCHFPQL